VRLKNWWRQKGRKSKAIAVISTLLILQIGLCFGTPSGVSWYQALFHVKSSDPLYALGLMAWEAILSLATVLALIVTAIFWHPDLNSPQRKKENHDR
jgi:ABC-type transport system involved in multi-copper enzyme maturation permease subunit